MPVLKPIVIPVIVIAVGVIWLLSTLNMLPDIDWVWTGALAILGVVTFVWGGFDKLTFVVGTFFLVASVSSVFRQTGRLSANIEVPMLVIIFGALLLISHLSPLKPAKWLQSPDENKT